MLFRGIKSNFEKLDNILCMESGNMPLMPGFKGAIATPQGSQIVFKWNDSKVYLLNMLEGKINPKTKDIKHFQKSIQDAMY